MPWYSKDLGSGVDAYEPTALIQSAVMQSISAALAAQRPNYNVAVFSYYDLRANMVTAWFSPGLEHIAEAFGATPCERPNPRERFGLLVGYPAAWDTYFPDRDLA